MTVTAEAARLAADLRILARRISFRDAMQACWDGRPLAAIAAAPPMPQPPLNPAVARLEIQLYTSFFCRSLGETPEVADDVDLTPALSAANYGRDGWDPAWHIAQVLPSGEALLTKGDRRHRAWPGEFACRLGLGSPPQPGMPVDVLVVRESLVRQPGVYFAFGPVAFDDDAQQTLVRFYWNVRPGGAAFLVGAVTAAFSRLRLPFFFKCMARTSLLDRCDGAVLYIARRDFGLALALVAEVHRALRPHLRPDVSPFVKALAPGLSLAEDPSTGASFGQERCRLVAEGFWLAHAAGTTGAAALVEAVLAHLRRRGVDPSHPHLNPGSVDRYVVPDDIRTSFGLAA